MSGIEMMCGLAYSAILSDIQKELIEKTISQQEAKIATWFRLADLNLPIPPDLDREMEEMTRPSWIRC